MKKIHPNLISILAISVFISACGSAVLAENTRTEFVLGTVCSVKLIQGGDDKTLDEVFARLRAIDDRMSANKDGTEIAAVNKAAGLQGAAGAVKVSDDTFYVISKALEYARLTQGVFDPSVGPLVKLWNIGTEGASVPPAKSIAAALKLIDWKKVTLDPAAKTVRLASAGMRLDLGAIAKGYSADECSRILHAHKVKAAIIDLGGNVLVFGKKKDGSSWKIGVQNPDDERGSFIGLVSGFDVTVVTSGIYERFFIQDGVRYHHILDTKTGFPVDNGLKSVTIIAESSTDADGLSTSVFALGKDKGLELVKSLKDVEAIIVDTRNRVWLSPGAGKVFKLTDTKYSLAE
ncbi:MAG: FAD:protein FMN transferase [Rectinemataceae bacterium]|nr:FAD:protein FMN transferase [Rectinemataceae bacterium]